jgi:hypothetical protein
VHLCNSVEWKLRDNVEWSVDVESEFLIQSFSLSLCLLVKIKNLPSLVGSVVSVMNLDSCAFLILSLDNIKASIRFLDVAEVFSSESKDLPPA